jgi:hypothetical protein
MSEGAKNNAPGGIATPPAWNPAADDVMIDFVRDAAIACIALVVLQYLSRQVPRR